MTAQPEQSTTTATAVQPRPAPPHSVIPTGRLLADAEGVLREQRAAVRRARAERRRLRRLHRSERLRALVTEAARTTRTVGRPVLAAVGVTAFISGMVLLLLSVPGAVELFSVAAAALILASAVDGEAEPPVKEEAEERVTPGTEA
ncbi:hypothetical protein ACFYWU_26870 [Streptomyces chrestomyceticus]|uniref:hypothetical protein n=1 Tax=Streptomyces chrestomyceticus TaxID=68185 RepID=UPI0036D2044A